MLGRSEIDATSIKLGSILYIPSREESLIDIGLDDGVRDHPCVYLGPDLVASGKVRIVMVS